MPELQILAPIDISKKLMLKTYFLSYDQVLDAFTEVSKVKLYFDETVQLAFTPTDAKKDSRVLWISGKIHAEDYPDYRFEDLSFKISSPRTRWNKEVIEYSLWIVIWKEPGEGQHYQGRVYDKDPWENY